MADSKSGSTTTALGPLLATPLPKTLVVILDGTWQDGMTLSNRAEATNCWRLARVIKNIGKVGQNVMVHYEAGVGAADWVPGERVSDGVQAILAGSTGMGLSTKVKEAYLALCLNWSPGDEVIIVGFSRGAYTARTVASIIDAIGFLDRDGLESFHQIYNAFLAMSDPSRKVSTQAKRYITNWRNSARPPIEQQPFLVKALAVWDTVGAQGLPKGIALPGRRTRRYMGFNDNNLGPRIEHGLHAIALHENRIDYEPTLWNFTPSKGQQIKQVYFTGSHSDIGGGWAEADLSDIALTWMASEIDACSNLAIDFDKMMAFMKPTKPYGQLKPHDPIAQGELYGILAKDHIREPLPGCLIHESVLSADYHSWPTTLHQAVDDAARTMSPTFTGSCRIARLSKHETRLRDRWTVVHPESRRAAATDKLTSTVKGIAHNFVYLGRSGGSVEPSLWQAPAAMIRATRDFLFA